MEQRSGRISLRDNVPANYLKSIIQDISSSIDDKEEKTNFSQSTSLEMLVNSVEEELTSDSEEEETSESSEGIEEENKEIDEDEEDDDYDESEDEDDSCDSFDFLPNSPPNNENENGENENNNKENVQQITITLQTSQDTIIIVDPAKPNKNPSSRSRRKQLRGEVSNGMNIAQYQSASIEFYCLKLPLGRDPIYPNNLSFNQSNFPLAALRNTFKRNNILFIDDFDYNRKYSSQFLTGNSLQKSLIDSMYIEIINDLKCNILVIDIGRFSDIRRKLYSVSIGLNGKDLVLTHIHKNPKKANNQIRCYLQSISELRKGFQTKIFKQFSSQSNTSLLSKYFPDSNLNDEAAQLKLLEKLAISFVCSGDKEINGIILSEKYEILINNLVKLIQYRKKEENVFSQLHYIWNEKVDHRTKAKLSLKEIIPILRELNLHVSKSKIHSHFGYFSSTKRELTFSQFLYFFRFLRKREEIEVIFNAFKVENSHFMNLQELQLFLQIEQKENYDLRELKLMIAPFLSDNITKKSNSNSSINSTNNMSYSSSGNEIKISLSAFESFLISHTNSVENYEITHNIYHDMDQPLCNYFINSSHNTYLEGNQLSSDSSCDQYKKVLQDGCRCLELDCWDGEDGEPIIFHGHTLTSKIKFEDACQTIFDYSFISSDYPVILSLENHCCFQQQKRMGEIMSKIFGPSLYRYSDLEENSLLPLLHPLPSPSALKRKILIKGKIDLPTASERPHSNSTPSPPPPIAKYCASDVGFISAPIIDLLTDSDTPKKLADITFLKSSKLPSNFQSSLLPSRNIFSFSEQNFDEEIFSQLSKTNLIRIYPKGTRLHSSNYSPSPFWSSGCQLVALNLQTPGNKLWINEGRFKDNGRSGYLLKPSILLQSLITLNNPALSTSPFAYPTKFSIQIFSARQLPFKSLVKNDQARLDVIISGAECDHQKERFYTKITNGSPNWQSTCIFPVQFPEFAVLLFVIYHQQSNLMKKSKVAYFSLPLTAVRPGFRFVPLKNPNGSPLTSPIYFVDFHSLLINFRW